MTEFGQFVQMKLHDRDGTIPVDIMRVLFEAMVKKSPSFRKYLSLTHQTAGRKFVRFEHDMTEQVWLGFGLGMRMAERMMKTGEWPDMGSAEE